VRKTLKQYAVEYGTTFVVVYLVIFTLVWVGFWAAIRFGWSDPGEQSTGASFGTWTAAYLATKVTQPLRIIGSVAITPPIARAWERITGRARSAPAS
jgi:hypothetical protein